MRPERGPAGPRPGGLAACLAVSAALAAGLLAPRQTTAQERPAAPTGGPGAGAWNGPRVLSLVREVARSRGGHPYGDTALQGFRARAEGHVYFLFDPGRPDAKRVVRADQLALKLAWEAPGRSSQRVVGRRSEKRLPTGIRYHTDHLRVFLEGLEPRITLGRGSEVRGVLHPLAPGAPDFYEYRLVDSLQVRLAGRRRRLYRVQVRPRDPASPAVVGEMFVDATQDALARLSVTFTPAAYRDPQLEHFTLDLRFALVHGRYWLPAEQVTELRRQVRWLDMPVGGTIRTRFRVHGYDLNPGVDLPAAPARRRTSAPDSAVDAYDGWRNGLYAGLRREGEAGGPAAGPADIDRLRDRAREIAARRALSGLAPFRLYYPDASHVLRIRRGEGVLLGAGGRAEAGVASARGWVGYPAGAGRPTLRGALSRGAGAGRWALTGCYRCLEDVGPLSAASGVTSTLSALAGSEDWRDPWFRSGAGIRWTLRGEGGSARLSAAWESHASAARVPGPQSGPGSRPVRGIRDGSGLRLRARASRTLGSAAGSRLRGSLAVEGSPAELGDFGYGRAVAALRAEPAPSAGLVSWEGELWTGAGLGTLPAQRLFLLGGRGTLPGHPFRGWGGDRLAYGRVLLSAGVARPWLRLRAGLAGGWAGVGAPGRRGASRLGVSGTRGMEASAVAGVGVFYGLLRVQAARGLGGGDWSVNLFLDPGFWEFL